MDSFCKIHRSGWATISWLATWGWLYIVRTAHLSDIGCQTLDGKLQGEESEHVESEHWSEQRPWARCLGRRASKASQERPVVPPVKTSSNKSMGLYLPQSHSPQSPVDPLPNETSQAKPAICERYWNGPQESESNSTRFPNVVEKSDFDSLSKRSLYRFHLLVICL